jgi:hypothetical protein
VFARIMGPYRTSPTGNAEARSEPTKDPARETSLALIVGGAPAALVALCATARALLGPWFMPTEIFYPACAYAAFLVCVCVVDVARR